VEIKKKILSLGLLLFLNNCMQSTAMVGPAITLASTGNIYQAGFSFGAGKAVENETGMTTTELLKNNIDLEKKDKNSELDKSLAILLELNIQKTREEIKKKN